MNFSPSHTPVVGSFFVARSYRDQAVASGPASDRIGRLLHLARRQTVSDEESPVFICDFQLYSRSTNRLQVGRMRGVTTCITHVALSTARSSTGPDFLLRRL
jgi:hypothetical protein